ncbi:histidine phosphatase super family protein [Rhodococcus sp. MTM3W5.2]|uniref:acid phosphatase n=1 Tax=Rhodococcus sp. MTM3W5.2 TaxID=1805827 RepID=UPI0009794C7D|nr:acid phosphatase [Rhodococcus sp. MTM3W5.2]AQA22395.1 histidine phosphatase super family protein [Rhodococcus sp. MTM3W5.2]
MSTARPRIALVRHGATEWALNGRHTGSTDIPLTAAGEEQARDAGRRIAQLGLRDPLVLTSPRSRATRTAELAGLGTATAWDALAEWDYGRYEGLTTPEIRESVPGWTVWSHPCPGGESAESVAARADMVLSTALSQLEERDVILVGHAHFSRALLARWAELPVTEGRRFAMDPAAISVLGFDHGVQQINSHNVTW